MGELKRVRNLETGVVWDVDEAHAEYLLTGGPNAREDFEPLFELAPDVDEGAPAEVEAASTPLGEGEATPPADPTPLNPDVDDRHRRDPEPEPEPELEPEPAEKPAKGKGK